MTLVMAGIADNKVWLIADTKLSLNYEKDVRKTFSGIKVEPAVDGLIGMAGNTYNAAPILKRAVTTAPGRDTISVLYEGARTFEHVHPDSRVDFCYAYFQNGKAKLVSIKPKPLNVEIAFLGSGQATSLFRKRQTDIPIESQPGSIHHLSLLCPPQNDASPDKMGEALRNMIGVCSHQGDGSVGGWITPFYLTERGAFVQHYFYNVVTDRQGLAPSGMLPLGSVEGGGYTVSLTGSHDPLRLVFYCPQRNVGEVFLWNDHVWEGHRFSCPPHLFSAEVKDRLGIDVYTYLLTGPPHTGPIKATPIVTTDGIVIGNALERGDGFGAQFHSLPNKPWIAHIKPFK